MHCTHRIDEIENCVSRERNKNERSFFSSLAVSLQLYFVFISLIPILWVFLCCAYWSHSIPFCVQSALFSLCLPHHSFQSSIFFGLLSVKVEKKTNAVEFRVRAQCRARALSTINSVYILFNCFCINALNAVIYHFVFLFFSLSFSGEHRAANR